LEAHSLPDIYLANEQLDNVLGESISRKPRATAQEINEAFFLELPD
jgi:hypothetical protein